MLEDKQQQQHIHQALLLEVADSRQCLHRHAVITRLCGLNSTLFLGTKSTCMHVLLQLLPPFALCSLQGDNPVPHAGEGRRK
jgi:hypothetical protein